MEKIQSISKDQGFLESENDKPVKLLFVDDERNILSSLKRLFHPLGYQIVLAESGPEALDILSKDKIDLVISDMRMPEMSGSEFLEIVADKWPDTMRILLTGYADMSSTVDAINKGKIYQYISKPWDDADIKIAVGKALQFKKIENERNDLLRLTSQQNKELKSLNENLDLKVKQRTSELEQTMDMLDVAHKELKNSFKSSIEAFASLVEMRGKFMSGHSRRTSGVCEKLAVKLGIDSEQSENIMYAGLLHDIGKIGFSDDMLNKPVNTMEDSELVKYRKHPEIGEAALLSLESFGNVSKLIRHHHEKFDGTGFPDGLKATDIPIGSRVLSLVSDYDSLCNGNMISTVKGQEKAREYVKKYAGRSYDPEIVDTFFEMLGPVNTDAVKMKKISSKEMQPGMVLAKNIMNEDGLLLLSEGFVFKKSVISRVFGYEISSDKKLEIFIKID